MTAPYLSISVQLKSPDNPYGPEAIVSWSATRYSSGHVEIDVHVHTSPDKCLRIAHRDALVTIEDVPAWVPRPPSGWLASLRMTAEPDRVAQASTALMAGGVW